MKKIDWKDVGKRAAKTFGQAFIATVSMEQVVSITDADSAKTVIWSMLVAGVSAGISAVWNMAAGYVQNKRRHNMQGKHDVRIDRSRLHPQLNYKLGKLLKLCEKKGIYLIVTEGFRSKEQQDRLYAQGRTAPGKIVTYARGSSESSQHQWGIAFDIAMNYDVDGDEKVTDDTWNPKGFKEVAKIAKSIGLGWGGDWKFVDIPHFYLKKWGSTTAKLKQQYGTFENFKKTWSKTVFRAEGLILWKDVLKANRIIRIPNGESVQVLHTKLWYAKVKYKGKYGFVNKKYLK